MILKLDEGLKDVGFIRDTILMLMTVEAGRTVELMLVRSKYCTELISKGETGQLWNGVDVVLVNVSEKVVARVAPSDTSGGIP